MKISDVPTVDVLRTCRVESPGLPPRIYTVPRETPCPETLRRIAAWLAWEAGMAWARSDEFPVWTWRDEHAKRLAHIALRAIDAAQPGQYLWRREWAWWFYAEREAPPATGRRAPTTTIVEFGRPIPFTKDPA